MKTANIPPHITMKITPKFIADIANRPCELIIVSQSDAGNEVYHGTVGEINSTRGCLRIKIAEARKISTDDGQPLVKEPEFFCTDPENRMTVRVVSETKGTDITLFNTPFVLHVFENESNFADYLTQRASRNSPPIKTQEDLEKFIDELTGTQHPA